MTDPDESSIWLATTPETDYDPLDGEATVDTAVLGGGIAGLTAAAELDRAGQSVAVIERDRIVEGTTGYTTAKLTSLHGLLYRHLLDTFGERHAMQYAAANEAAIEAVAERIDEFDLDCEFARTPAYTYAATGDRETRRRVRREVEAARRLDLPASYVDDTDLPYEVGAAVRFDGQARFDPRSYLLGLADRIDGDGSHVFEQTTAEDVQGGRTCRVETDPAGPVRADRVIVATHFPISDHGFYFARMRPKYSYVLAARLDGDVPEGMYYDPADPYFSVREHPTGAEDLVLLGGQNHRTGHGGDTAARHRALEKQARERFDIASIEHRWATQDFVSVDRVPFVGKLAPQVRNVYVATGFGGWGMTNGVASGLLLADLVRDRENAWEDVYRPTRWTVPRSIGELSSHNLHAANDFVTDRLESRPALADADLDPGEGGVFDSDDGPVAASRDEDGDLHVRSAVCTHLGCLVHWNGAAETWDCPCHGSRFAADGSVVDTPAIADLPGVDDGDE